jgi:hypothetical protein
VRPKPKHESNVCAGIAALMVGLARGLKSGRFESAAICLARSLPGSAAPPSFLARTAGLPALAATAAFLRAARVFTAPTFPRENGQPALRAKCE